MRLLHHTWYISTHTSRVGCDFIVCIVVPNVLNFYSHIPCGMWQSKIRSFGGAINFYSHIPCGMWRRPVSSYDEAKAFLLTHPVWDVTITHSCIITTYTNFYSHIPCGMWRGFCSINYSFENFYSHIPCGMWLLRITVWNNYNRNFYSHIPCGMWRNLF